MEIKIQLRGENIQLTKDIHLKDIECKCGQCPYVLFSQTHLNSVQFVMDKINREFIITSGYRCNNWNFKIGGEVNSQHTYGLATDLQLTNDHILKYKNEFDLLFKGMGEYDSFIHVDSRLGQKSRWVKKSS